MTRFGVAALVCLALAGPAVGQPRPGAPDAGLDRLLEALQHAAATGEPDAYLQLVAADADRATALRFARDSLRGPPVAHVALRQLDFTPLDEPAGGGAYRLVVELLFDGGSHGRLTTWQLDVRRAAEGDWRIVAQRQLSSFDNLYRLAIDPTRELAGQGLVVTAEDLELTLTKGSAFVATVDGGTTALVLVGSGEMIFSPAPASERGQIKIASGTETLRTPFDACFIRLHPSQFARHFARQPAAERVEARALQRAQAVFAEDAPRSFTLDIGDLDPGPWSILPSPGDFLAEIHTRRYGTLTYTRSMREPEAIAVFDRAHRHYFALYPAGEQLASHGRFYSDDDRADYTVLHYDVDATFAPDREWLEGRTRMVLRVRAASVSNLRLRLAEPLAIQSVVSNVSGRVLAVRVRGQNTVMVTLPDAVQQGTEIVLTVAYAGRLPPERTASEGAAQPGGPPADLQPIRVEPSFLYSVRSAWYAQSPQQDFATATLRLTVPAPWECVASGTLVSTGRSNADDAQVPGTPATQFVFETPQPVRYLACLITRLIEVRKKTVAPATLLTVDANPGEQGHAAQVAAQAEDILRFYSSLVGERPYSDLTVAVIERDLPGGHSPAYLAILNEQVATSRLRWQEDPAAFSGFPEFFVAHEIAHQWWGQAIGGKNYHEEWLSEAFAQYFAALYAEHAHGRAEMDTIVRQMQRWTLRESSQGPVYLGPRVGQLKNDGQAQRAVVYDKGALVLHMLRRLVGDEAFFGGLRLFYRTWRFKNAGSDDLRKAFEEASGAPLERFFERWIYRDTLPRLKFSWRAASAGGTGAIDVRFEQQGDVFDMPMTVTVEYAEGAAEDIVVPITDAVVERRIPVRGRVRRVLVNGDSVVPVEISGR